MVMPLVVCRSEGGGYDDPAFVAGFTCGTIWAALQTAQMIAAGHLSYMVQAPLLPQLDLFGMHFGYAVKSEPVDGHPNWAIATFRLPEEAPTPDDNHL